MRFQFPLEGLLRVRRLLERQARERLDKSMTHMRILEHKHAEAVQWSQNTMDARLVTPSLPAAELQFVESVLHQTQCAIDRCQHEKQLEEQHAAALRANYLQARGERKTVGTLRDKALHTFQIEQSRREQSDLDEFFVGKLVHSRNAAELALRLKGYGTIHEGNLT